MTGSSRPLVVPGSSGLPALHDTLMAWKWTLFTSWKRYRRRGFARSAMLLLIEECGRNETLYMHSKIELVDFYGSLGFYPIPETDLPKTIQDRFGFCMGNLKGIDVCPMKRDPTDIGSEVNT